MTKQEQIEEIKQVLIKTCKRCRSFEEDYMQSKYAEALYNAGYCKVDEIQQLKKENACLLKTCEEKFTFDTTQNKKYSIFNSVRKEFADNVTAKLFTIFGKTICSDLDTEDITDIIDELLREYE